MSCKNNKWSTSTFSGRQRGGPPRGHRSSSSRRWSSWGRSRTCQRRRRGHRGRHRQCHPRRGGGPTSPAWWWAKKASTPISCGANGNTSEDYTCCYTITPSIDTAPVLPLRMTDACPERRICQLNVSCFTSIIVHYVWQAHERASGHHNAGEGNIRFGVMGDG